MKKDMIKNIVISVLSLALIILIIVVFLVKGDIKYKYFDNDLVEINNKTNFKDVQKMQIKALFVSFFI